MRGSSTAHTAVKVMRKSIQRALARKELSMEFVAHLVAAQSTVF